MMDPLDNGLPRRVEPYPTYKPSASSGWEQYLYTGNKAPKDHLSNC